MQALKTVAIASGNRTRTGTRGTLEGESKITITVEYYY